MQRMPYNTYDIYIIVGFAKFSHTMVLFSESRIVKLEKINYCAEQVFMYRHDNILLPDIDGLVQDCSNSIANTLE